MQPWSALTVDAVSSVTGDLTQLYPSHVAAGSGATTMGTQRRTPTEGVLYSCRVYCKDGYGGVFELWDVSGLPSGTPNNVDTGTAITNTYLTAEITAQRGKLLWKQSFKADAGAREAVFSVRVPFLRGLAGRYVDVAAQAAAKGINVEIVADGGFRYIQICG